jgi:two-component system, cell cycle response regulator DivK
MNATSGKNRKILIIDDDSRNIFALSSILKARGYEVISAEEAARGIELMKRDEEIGIVLLDMMMPGIDGYQALEIIRNTRGISQLPVIAVTAQAMAGDREKCMKAGAAEYISKPVDIDKLTELLKKQLGS